MSKVDPIIELHPWLALPSGKALLDWEQDQIDRLVADIFGFHAVQLGLPELDGLRANRMPHQWRLLDGSYHPGDLSTNAAALYCDFGALPYPNHSLDLVVLPHALELAHDPHAVLREVERVLVPEGRVLIIGFNPFSLWGLWQGLGRWGVKSATVLPQGEFISYWRLRDWLRLLNLDVESGCFGCYRPMVPTDRAWGRLRWLERAGARWWPVLGAVYCVVAVKRARGLRLIGKVKRTRVASSAAPAVVAQRHVQQDQIG